MREIKFRAWDIEDGEFIYFDLYSVVGLRPEELDNAMQYTGRKDKNGVELYEGDILSVDYSINECCINFVVSIPNIYEENTEDCCSLIGNIYENPELLEEK